MITIFVSATLLSLVLSFLAIVITMKLEERRARKLKAYKDARAGRMARRAVIAGKGSYQWQLAEKAIEDAKYNW